MLTHFWQSVFLTVLIGLIKKRQYLFPQTLSFFHYTIIMDQTLPFGKKK